MILASQSPRRLALLRKVGIEPTVIVPDIDETPLPAEQPEPLVERLARTKAAAVVGRAEPGEPCVAADTVVWLDGAVLGKPRDDEDAKVMLGELSGTTHHVSTGLCIAWTDEEGCHLDSMTDTCEVTFFDLTSRQIADYVATGEGRDKAGAYAIQGIGRLLVERISGNHDTVIGLPVARLHRRLQELGLQGR